MSMNHNPIDQDPIDHIEETAANRIGSRIREIRLARGLTQVKYLKVWYSALDIYKTRLSQAHNTEEAEAELKRYNLFKWSLPMVPADEDATSMQIKMYDELIDELREKLRVVELRAQGEHEKPSS